MKPPPLELLTLGQPQNIMLVFKQIQAPIGIGLYRGCGQGVAQGVGLPKIYLR